MERPVRSQRISGPLRRGSGEIQSPDGDRLGLPAGAPRCHPQTLRRRRYALGWFAADWTVARRKFKERGIIPVGLFDIQIRKIETALPEINALFRSHVEYTLPSTGIYTPPDKIWESMVDTLAGTWQ
jgi:hypothetical protein